MSIRTVESVQVGNYSFHVNRAGAGNARKLLFLHGSGPGVTALSNWEGAIERLGDRFDCIAPDVLGFGDSTHPEEPPHGMTAFTRLRVQTLFSLLDVLEIEEVDVIGNSMGGLIAMEMAFAQPQRIGRITLQGTGGVAFEPSSEVGTLMNFYDAPSAEGLEMLMRSFLHDPESFGDLGELSRRRIDLATRPDVQRSHLATFADGSHEVDLTVLAALEHPVMLVHGREDRIIPFSVSVQLVSIIRNSHLHVLGNCGHWTQLEKPGEFDALVGAFHGRDGL